MHTPLGLFRPPSPAAAGRVGLYILLLYVFFFGHRLSRVGPSGACRYYTNSVAPSAIRKWCTNIRPMLPHFLQGAKCPKFWPKFPLLSSLDRHIFELRHFIGKQKQTCQGRMIGLPSYQTWIGWVPPTLRTVGAMGTPKGKTGKFLIYPPFQWPTPSTAPQMLYHLLGPQLL